MVVINGWKVKFGLERSLIGQMQDMVDTLSLLNFAAGEFYYVDLRVPKKVYVCRDRRCNR